MGRSVLAGLILEPISKSLEEDDKASELHEAEEVLRIELPADEDEGCGVAIELKRRTFRLTNASHVAGTGAPILRSALGAIGSEPRDHLDVFLVRSLSSGSLS